MVVAYQNFSIPFTMSGILGIGYFRHMLSIQKSVMTLAALFFFGMMNVEATHAEEAI
jgi:hypothetical protein